MPNNSVDELYLLNKDEKPLSQKFLAVVGGITSFGAILPVFLNNFSKIFGGSSYWGFKILIGLYFLLPIVTVAAWLLISRWPQSFYIPKSQEAQVNDLPHSRIHLALTWLLISLGIQFIVGLLMITCQEDQMNDYDRNRWSVIYILLQVTLGGLLWMILYRKDKSRQLKRLATPFSVLLVLGIATSIALPQVFAEKKDNNKEVHVNIPANNDGSTKRVVAAKGTHDTGKRSDYNMLSKISALNSQVARIEKRTRNTVERYRLKSHMAWTAQNIGDDQVKAFRAIVKDTICYRRYLIEPYTYFLNMLILSDSSGLDSAHYNFNLFIATQGLDTGVRYCDITFFEADNVFNVYVRHFREGKMIDAYVPLIDSTLLMLLGHGKQRVLPDSLQKDRQLLALFRQKKLIPDSTMNGKMAKSFAVYLDEVNSERLNSWIQDFIAFIQRRARKQARDSSQQVAWIFKDTQVQGLLIFATMIISMLIFYILLSSEASYLRKRAIDKADEAERTSTAEAASAGNEQIKKQLDLTLKLTDFHLFPIITFLGIIVALIIPLCKPIVAEDIQLSRPDWFLAVPNWNMTAATADAIRSSSPAQGTENNITDAADKQVADTRDGDDISTNTSTLDTRQYATKQDVYDASNRLMDSVRNVRERVRSVSGYLTK